MSITAALALLAATGVLVGGGLLAATRPGEKAASAASGGGIVRVVETAGSFEVGQRWSRPGRGSVVSYRDPAVSVAGAVVADAGYCRGRARSLRAFAGFATASPGEGDTMTAATAAVAALTGAQARRWARAVGGRAPPPVETTAVRLADGTPAARATLTVTPPRSADPCAARRVRLDVIGFAVTGRMTVWVLVRDVDPHGVGDAEADRMVASLRPP